MRISPFHISTVVLLAVLGAGLACSDSTGPVTPERIERIAGDGQQGRVAQALPQPLTVRVVDAGGRGVSGVPVSWEVTGGGGSVAPSQTQTDGRGEASVTWTLGTTSGPQAAAATVEGLAGVGFSANATPAAAEKLQKFSGDEQQGLTGQPLPEPVSVIILDPYGNALPGTPVSWTVLLGGGSVDPTVSQADSAGIAATTWTMGGSSGDHRLMAAAGDLEPVTFRAHRLTGIAASIEFGADSVRLSIGASTRVVTVVRDSVGNAIAGASIDWSSSDPGVATVDGTGLISAVDEGLAWIRAESGPASDSLRIRAIDGPTLNFIMDGAYITQSTQTYDGSVPLVRGRGGLLRVFVRANELNDANPVVRVNLYHDGALTETVDVTSADGHVPLTVNEGLLDLSWNVWLDGELIRPGLAIEAVVNPDGALQEADDTDNRFPLAAGPAAMNVDPTPPFRARFVPVHQSSTGRTGNVSAANIDQFMDRTHRMFPLPGYDVEVRATYTSSTPPLQSDDDNNAWRDILGEMGALRTADGSTRHYHGIVNPPYNSGIAGFAFVPGLTAVSWDRLPGAGNVVAHEFGHNFGRRHAPCRPGGGNPPNVDPHYPDPEARIGAYGYDIVANTVRPPTERDIMSYCYEWIGPYTYVGALNHRAQSDAAMATAAAVHGSEILVVWGRGSSRELVLEPAFESTAPPSLPARSGPYRIQGLDEAGEVLFSYDFRGEAVSHGHDADRLFSFGIPLTPDLRTRLGQLRLTGPTARGVETVVQARAELRQPLPAADPDPVIQPRAPDAVTLRWDAATHPLVVVRDPRTGDILSLARGGEAAVVTDSRELDLQFSDGVRSTPRRVFVPGR